MNIILENPHCLLLILLVECVSRFLAFRERAGGTISRQESLGKAGDAITPLHIESKVGDGNFLLVCDGQILGI